MSGARMGESAFGTPVVATAGAADPSAPLVVLLHGRGSTESEILALAPHLPTGPEYVAVRAPIASGRGYAWFENRGIGRPVAESLRETMDWFTAWLDDIAPRGRPVVLVGFSGGAAFAGGLVLDDPSRYVGAAILYGTLPFDAGLALEAGALAHLPVFVAQGEEDRVIPTDLLGRTWTWLLAESGAPVVAQRLPGGHELMASTLRDLGSWLAQRLLFVSKQNPPAPGLRSDASWQPHLNGELPRRAGGPPEVSWTIPQQQETQTSPAGLQEELFRRVQALEGVRVEASRISVPGARAFLLDDAGGRDEAFLVPGVGEFAHLHPRHDGSMHLALPPDLAADVTAKGWGRAHMWAGTRLSPGFVMVYGPRDAGELEIVVGIVEASHAHALGSARDGQPAASTAAI